MSAAPRTGAERRGRPPETGLASPGLRDGRGRSRQRVRGEARSCPAPEASAPQPTSHSADKTPAPAAVGKRGMAWGNVVLFSAIAFLLAIAFLIITACGAGGTGSAAMPDGEPTPPELRDAAPSPQRPAAATQRDARDGVVVDALGNRFPVPIAPPGRIVSLAPNVTEILFALGLGDRLVGVTRFCDYPLQAAAIEKTGGLVDPNLERIHALRPDLVIAFRGNPLRALERLKSLGHPVFVLDIGRDLDGLIPMIEAVGRVTARAAAAEALAAGLRARLAAAAAASAGAHRPKAFLLLFGSGLWTCGRGSYLHDLLVRAGARNAAAGSAEAWLAFDRERLLLEDPDLIFVLAPTDRDFLAVRRRLERELHLEGLRAVRTGRIHRLDENIASRFGPRLLDALDATAAAVRLAAEARGDRAGEPAGTHGRPGETADTRGRPDAPPRGTPMARPGLASPGPAEPAGGSR